jgi:hypothetical protein
MHPKRPKTDLKISCNSPFKLLFSTYYSDKKSPHAREVVFINM